MKEKWNQKFSGEEYLYGKTPNDFYKQILDKLQAGKILLLGEGEGRNAVYAAEKGWEVDAVDFSDIAREKALKLAAEKSVQINYKITDISTYAPKEQEYDAVAIIFLHFTEEIREIVHKRAISSLKKGGSIIMQIYDKEQIKNGTGGPKSIDYLYSLEDVYNDFHELQFDLFTKERVDQSEGSGHSGIQDVIKFHGKKI